MAGVSAKPIWAAIGYHASGGRIHRRSCSCLFQQRNGQRCSTLYTARNPGAALRAVVPDVPSAVDHSSFNQIIGVAHD
jgi:hypothetical protein